MKDEGKYKLSITVEQTVYECKESYSRNVKLVKAITVVHEDM